MPEYRSIQQIKLFALIMNPMNGRAEDARIALASDDYNRLIAAYNNFKLPQPEQIDGYYHFFRKDTPLYWFNDVPSVAIDRPTSLGHGVIATWEDVNNLGAIKSRTAWV